MARQTMTDDGKPSGKYFYTYADRDGTMAIGYCQEGCNGHATSKEACDHYYQYLLDKMTRYDCRAEDALKKCLICKQWTDRYILTDDGAFSYQITLCDRHANTQGVMMAAKDLDELMRVGQ